MRVIAEYVIAEYVVSGFSRTGDVAAVRDRRPVKSG
jgi:hypothetical protein